MVLGQLQTPSRSEWTPPGSSIDVIYRLFNDVPSAPQPNVEPIPVVQIQYSKDFAYIMGLYLSMVRNLASRPTASNSSSMAVVSAPSTRWLMLLGVVLVKCPSHYTAWKQRRDVVMNHQHMYQLCCSDVYAEQPHAVAPSELLDVEEEALTFWTPARSDIGGFVSLPSSSSSSASQMPPASLWKCVLWELLTTAKCFVRDFHKNFQLWHHRKELIMCALEQTPAEHLASVGAFNQYLAATHPQDQRTLTFADFDERTVCDVVLLDEDSKNYHVWSHRAWFLMSFPFMATPLSFQVLVDSVLGEHSADGFAACIDVNHFVPLALSELKWNTGAAEVLPSPNDVSESSLFLEELHYTARRIGEDWFNNSAWCHRFTVFKKYLAEPLLAGECDSEVLRRAVFYKLCVLELHYALRWAVVEPCNECPFVYAKGVADLWQMSALNLPRQVAEDAEEGDGLLLSGALQQRGVTWAQYRQSQALHDASIGIIEQYVAPVVADIRKSTALGAGEPNNEDELHSTTRNIFLRNNTHQPTAAIFRMVFDRMESTWTTYLEQAQKEAHIARFPIETFELAEKGEELSSSNNDLPLLEDALHFWEMKLVQLGSLLHATDVIRAKYWRHMVHTVVHRRY